MGLDETDGEGLGRLAKLLGKSCDWSRSVSPLDIVNAEAGLSSR